MIFIRLCSSLTSFSKIVQHRIKNTIYSYPISPQGIVNKAKFSKLVDFNSQLKSDVLLFKGIRPKYFSCIHLFSAIQLFYWCGLAYIVIEMGSYEWQRKDGFWQWFFKNEKKYYFASVFLFIGLSICASSLMFTLRLVESLTLHKGGMKVTITTHKFLGKFNTKVEVPIRKVSAVATRDIAKAYVTFKVQNKPFYFLMTAKGDFKNPLLFDQTVGKKRDFF